MILYYNNYNIKSNKMLSLLYKPTNQKSLFNQSSVNNIKKWLKNLINLNDYKKILFLYGSDGCGKTSTLNLLLKQYNVFNIDGDQIRVNDVLNDYLNTLPDYNSNTIHSIIQKNNTIGNIVLLDDTKNNEKCIYNLIENLYDLQKKNIPLIVCCSDLSFKQKFKTTYDTTFIDFNTITTFELQILIKKIFNDKKKEIIDENINNIIETSQGNLHQVYYIIEHLLSLQDLNNPLSLDNLTKDNDIDLSNRIKELFKLTKKYDFSKIYELMDVDTYVVNANIFQNYLKIYETNNTCDIADEISRLNYISLSCDSFVNNAYDNIFENDTNYSIINGMQPLYYLYEYHKNKGDNKEKTHSNINTDNDLLLEHYSGFTHNYITNLNELKSFNYESYNNLYNDNNLIQILNRDNMWFYVSMMNDNLNLIQKCLNIKKRNVQYQTYIDILKQQNMYDKYMFIINTIWNYALFETNLNVLKIKFKKQDITINLRIFKRLLNIFSLNGNNNGSLKTYVEYIIKEDLILKIIQLQSQNNLISDDNINNMMYDLSDLWISLKNK